MVRKAAARNGEGLAAALAAVALATLTLAAPAPAAAQVNDRAAELLGKANRAFENQSFSEARKLAAKARRQKLLADDYALYIEAQSAYFEGDYGAALTLFEGLAKRKGSRFVEIARQRIADALWHRGRRAAAAKLYREQLRRGDAGDAATARYRITTAERLAGNKKGAVSAYRDLVLRHALHPLAERATAEMIDFAGPTVAKLSATDRISRARRLTAAKLWHQSIAELEKIPDSVGPRTKLMRDFWTGMTLFKMRRQYERAGRILLGLYKNMGARAAEALFHGARALSRADLDKEAVLWYQRVVSEYPRSKWAPEAQFLSGWLEFNMGNYKEGLPYLEKMKELYPRSKWTRSAGWYLGMSHYLLGDCKSALPYFETLGKQGGRLSGGKGRYWKARCLHKQKRRSDAKAAYLSIIKSFPFSWYALLSQERLGELGARPDNPFGGDKSARGPAIAKRVSAKVAADPLIRLADELIAAGLPAAAGIELRRGEKPFLKRHPRAEALGALLDRYRKAGNFNRPWMLAVVHSNRSSLQRPPKGAGKVWWEHAYPKAYGDLVDKWQQLGKLPDHYLHSIMRKESGFNPHTHSYADAIGLVQMIPPTTKRVVKELGISYTDDLLFDPELNIRTGSWYIGHLLQKFKGQIPFGAGSFNSGPRPVMRWLDKNGKRPTDEFVELVSYSQTREYMKKVTETYARYLYLYDGKVYRQPMTVDPNYVKDELTY